MARVFRICNGPASWLATLAPVVAIFSAVIAISAIAETLDLPVRDGPRPQTTNGVPHVQIGISPVPELSSELLRRVEAIDGVKVRDTVISLPGALGFQLEDNVELAQPNAIVGGREFAHLHPDGSLHASLSPELAVKAVETGWAVHHPWAGQRPGWEGFVMIYTPQSEHQLEVVFKLVLASYSYVTGRAVE